MTMADFIKTYCSDIVAEREVLSKSLEYDWLPFDALQEDEETGETVRVILDEDGERIPIFSILGIGRDDFMQQYPRVAALKAYDNYIASICLVEGEDVINMVRRKLEAEMEALKEFSGKGGLDI